MIGFRATVLAFFLASLFCVSAHAQRFQWDHLRAGISVQGLAADGDLGKYWKNTLLGGPTFHYTINDDYSAVGILGFMYFRKSAQPGQPAVPDLFLISATGELERTILAGQGVRVCLRAGLGNYRFMFRINEYNNTESEFGAVGSLTVEFPESLLKGASILVQRHAIFASPEWIRLWTFGMALYLL